MTTRPPRKVVVDPMFKFPNVEGEGMVDPITSAPAGFTDVSPLSEVMSELTPF